MSPGLTPSRLLEIWDAGQRLHPIDRAVLMASVALGDADGGAAGDLAIGARDCAILRLRQATIGDRLIATSACPACGAACEITLSVDALVRLQPADAESDGTAPRYRLPSSRDVAAALADTSRDPEAVVLERCAVGVVDVDEITSAAESLAALIYRHDPLAEIQLDLACHACGRTWTDVLDPAVFVWQEIDARARALLDDVAQLAEAYGWSEPDVLALSDARRAAYLERTR